jgi:hypothetical protein
MATEADPIVTIWYKNLDSGQKFQVVAVDDRENMVEIQYFDGDIEEIDVDDWYLMELDQIESPEDISGALDVSEIDDLGASITDTSPSDWEAPAQEPKTFESDNMLAETVGSDELNEAAIFEEPWDEL